MKIFSIDLSGSILQTSGENETLEPGDPIGEDE